MNLKTAMRYLFCRTQTKNAFPEKCFKIAYRNMRTKYVKHPHGGILVNFIKFGKGKQERF